MTRRRSFHSREQISFQGETSAIATRPWPADARPCVPIAAFAISSAVTGRCGDIDGVWIEPVTAQVMITFRALMRTFLPLSNAWAS